MEYDNMFGIRTLEEIERFLTNKLEEAYGEKDYYSAITLLNELMGFCRDTSQKEKGVRYCKQVVALMDNMGLSGTVEYATTLLNVANAYRAFGYFDSSLKLYDEVEKIYGKKLPKGEFNYASLYNNWSLLYQEMQDFHNAKDMLEKALLIVDSFPKARMEQATTRTNLGATLLRIYQQEDDESSYNMALDHLKRAIKIYESDGGRDFHYSGALSAMGDAFYLKKDYVHAMDYYSRAMKEVEKHVGQTDAYYRVLDNYNRAKRMQEEVDRVKKDEEEKAQLKADRAKRNEEIEEQLKTVRGKNTPHIWKNNMERCVAFYEKYGRPMIREKFSEYVSRIAIGLVGEGSDCFGYDDDISKDHDYGVGFCLWLTEKDYAEIGVELHREYEKLVLDHGKEFYECVDIGENIGVKAHIYLDSRRGVFTIRGFYEKLLGAEFANGINWQEVEAGKTLVIEDSVWWRLLEENLAAATNGKVFRDDMGSFSNVRKALMSYYPKKLWFMKLGEALHTFSQNGQYNYGRMMARRDYVTANMCVNNAIKGALSVIYLLNNTYAPYYKWMWKGTEKLQTLREICPILERISLTGNQARAWEYNFYNPYEPNMSDKIVAAIEAVAALILGELNKEKIIRGNDTFLDIYCKEIAGKGEKMLDRNDLIEKIVKHEWEQFDKVKNEGGRADCQDDWNTFSLMRRSQYMAWTDELLESYLGDLLDAEEKGWNLIMEKYARMMKSTTPEKYKELEKDLPVRDDKRIAIQEEIIRLQVEWMEDFAGKYPKMAGNARSIHTSEDNPYNTSYETYLRGELGTYSEHTLLLYGRFVVDIQRKGENLAYNIMNNTAMLYGYKSVEDAESRL